MLLADPQGQSSAPVPQGQDPKGQLRIYQGVQHRFIWPVHLAGWLEHGWTTEPGVTPRVTPRATPTVTSAPRKKRASSSPIEANPANENPTGANPVGASPSGVNPVGVGSATADEPLPALVTDFLVDPSVPTDA